MANSDKSPCPTGPGWWWCRFDGGRRMVVELDGLDPIAYIRAGNRVFEVSTDDDRVEWLGPAPMPGEWAPREMFYELWRLLALYDSGGDHSNVGRMIDRCREWDDANPAPEATP